MLRFILSLPPAPLPAPPPPPFFGVGSPTCSPQEVVLNVRMRKPNSRSYGPPQELVWDSSHGTSAASLKLEIACRLLLPEDTLTIAKHFPDQFHWKVLTDHTQVSISLSLLVLRYLCRELVLFRVVHSEGSYDHSMTSF